MPVKVRQLLPAVLPRKDLACLCWPRASAWRKR